MEKQPMLITFVPDQPAPQSAFEPEPELDAALFEALEEEEAAIPREPTIADLNNATGQDKLDLLATLMQKMSKGDLATIANAYASTSAPKTRKANPQAGTVEQYKVITVHTYCRNCDHSYIYTTQLETGQHKSYVRQNGTVGFIQCRKNFDPMTIQSWTTQCEMCKTRMSRWTREMLEERYMQLLCRLTFDETPTTTNDWS